MKLGEYLKSKGLKLKNVCEITGQSPVTLRNWYESKNKRKVFDLMIIGILNL